MFAAGIDCGPTRRLVAADRAARDHRHPRLDRNFRGQLCHGKAVRRGLARTDNRERRHREHLRVATDEQRLRHIGKFQNSSGKQPITGMQFVADLTHH